MNVMNQYTLFISVFVATLLLAGPVPAADVTYTTSHIFTIDDVQCDRGVYGTDCLDTANPVEGGDGLTYYPIDSAYGWNVEDFNPAALLPRPMDGVYEEGFVTNLTDDLGQVIGMNVHDPPTADWKAGPLGGEWVMGLGALKAKTATEQYVVMDHILNAPWMPPLIEAVVDPLTGELGLGDYATRLKDDGKILYYWGNTNKEPTPVYVYAALSVPDPWKVPGANYTVKSAKLIISHHVTNSPNDQIRPEDFENEMATGILPSYEIAADGSWVSTVESYEGGDGEFLPIGTVLRDAAGNFTNAWYVSLDRDPFGGDNPRWRLKSSKYGQNLPGVEIPQYPVTTPTTTTIDLLSPMKDPVTGLPMPSLLLESSNWNAYLDANDGIVDGFTVEDCRLTPDFDLMLYIKGEVGKPTPLYNARLVIVYDDPDVTEPPPPPPTTPTVDLELVSISAPNKVAPGSSVSVLVTVRNNFTDAAAGVLTLMGTDKKDVVVASFTADVLTPSDSVVIEYGFGWTAPSYSTVVSWEAIVTAEGDINSANNDKSSTTLVK
ncbi:MAG TPA: hypothetical protein DCO77_07500 [Nitrospiraceae bacterium]|nr:hypothetical protein [Nitrospiraceae bacterium]